MKIEPLSVPWHPRVINWDAQPFGIETDEAIAEILNVSAIVVSRERRRRGIRRHPTQEREVPRIDWDSEPLGIETDRAIADRLGVTPVAVLHARRDRGIPSAPLSARRPPTRKGTGIDWNNEPLGIEPDWEIAQLLGVAPSTVRRERRRRGLSPDQFWDAQPLGIETDYAIAKRLGVSIAAVFQARKSRGIPPAISRTQRRAAIPFLGKMPDTTLAKEMGLSVTTIRKHRRKAGIAKFEQGKDGG